jgi:hypothetical protein
MSEGVGALKAIESGLGCSVAPIPTAGDGAEKESPSAEGEMVMFVSVRISGAFAVKAAESAVALIVLPKMTEGCGAVKLMPRTDG